MPVKTPLTDAQDVAPGQRMLGRDGQTMYRVKLNGKRRRVWVPVSPCTAYTATTCAIDTSCKLTNTNADNPNQE